MVWHYKCHTIIKKIVMSKYYLTLHFNGHMLLENMNENGKGLFKQGVTSYEKENVKKLREKYDVKITDVKRGYNYKNIIPYTLLSNILVCLCGGIPIPTNPIRREKIAKNVKRTELYDIIDEITKNKSYYKIDNMIDYETLSENIIGQFIGEDGDTYNVIKDGFKTIPGSEFMQSSKLKLRSCREPETVLFKDDEEKKIIVKGEYNRRSFLRLFDGNKNDADYVKIHNILNDIYGDEIFKLTFTEQCEYFHSNNDENIRKKIMENLPIFDEIWKRRKLSRKDSWFFLMFNYGKANGSSNTKISHPEAPILPKTFLRNHKGVSIRKQNIKGHIILEIEDERIIDALHKNSGFCDFMHDGTCEIVELSKNKPSYDYETNWTKISDEKPFQFSINQLIA